MSAFDVLFNMARDLKSECNVEVERVRLGPAIAHKVFRSVGLEITSEFDAMVAHRGLFVKCDPTIGTHTIVVEVRDAWARS